MTSTERLTPRSFVSSTSTPARTRCTDRTRCTQARSGRSAWAQAPLLSRLSQQALFAVTAALAVVRLHGTDPAPPPAAACPFCSLMLDLLWLYRAAALACVCRCESPVRDDRRLNQRQHCPPCQQHARGNAPLKGGGRPDTYSARSVQLAYQEPGQVAYQAC
jgi:hypothetical protein